MKSNIPNDVKFSKFRKLFKLPGRIIIGKKSKNEKRNDLKNKLPSFFKNLKLDLILSSFL